MRKAIQFKRKLSDMFYGIGKPVQFHYVDLPCYMYFGYENREGIPQDKLVLMYRYKQYIKEKAPKFDVRSKYFDAVLEQKFIKNYIENLEFEKSLSIISEGIIIPDYKKLEQTIKESRKNKSYYEDV